MRYAFILITALVLAPIVRADDVADVKQAYLTYTQATIDRDVDAIKAASFGDAPAKDFIPVGIELHTLRRKVMDEMNRLNGQPVKPQDPKAVAADVKAMVEKATVTVDGDNATLVPKGFPKGYRLRKIEGQWRYDLESMDHAPWEQQLQIAKRTLPLMRDMAAGIDRGEYKTVEQLQQAMDAVQREMRGGATPTTAPSSRPK